jgi:hypothetical protein
MKRLTYLTALALLMAGVAACDSRRDERPSGAETGTGTGTGSEPGTAGETGGLSEQDKKEGRVMETPGDSVRLEDTLSTPPPSDSTK